MKAVHRVLDPHQACQAIATAGLCALAVMTKAPRAGQVKTRLVPPLSPDEAAELNRSFLRDTAAEIARAGADLARAVAVYTPAGTEADYANILPATFSLLPQRDGNFAERLVGAADDLFRCGFDAVCLIDSDSPTVPAESYAQAARSLLAKNDRVVLGPSDDGGYYLIGLKKLHRRLFEEIDWSTARVLDQTIERANELHLPVELLPAGYDVDDAAGLRRLCDELLAQKSSATEIAPHTREFLSRLLAQRAL